MKKQLSFWFCSSFFSEQIKRERAKGKKEREGKEKMREEGSENTIRKERIQTIFATVEEANQIRKVEGCKQQAGKNLWCKAIREFVFSIRCYP
jgi:hypothetical protein